MYRGAAGGLALDDGAVAGEEAEAGFAAHGWVAVFEFFDEEARPVCQGGVDAAAASFAELVFAVEDEGAYDVGVEAAGEEGAHFGGVAADAGAL